MRPRKRQSNQPPGGDQELSTFFEELILNLLLYFYIINNLDLNYFKDSLKKKLDYFTECSLQV